MKAGRRRGGSSVAVAAAVAAAVVDLGARELVVVGAVVVDAVDPFGTEVLAEDEADGCSWRTGRVVVLERPNGRLLAVVAVVVVVDVEAIDPADGGRGGRRVVALVRDVAWDFVRECDLVTGDCGFAVEEAAVVKDRGREEVVGESLGAEDMDFGLASLVDVVVGRTVLAGCSACSVASFCVAGLRVARLFDRSRPKMPEFGLLLVPVVEVVEVEGIPLRAPVVPARVRVAVVMVVVEEEEPNFGSLLGELVRGSVVVAGAGAEVEPPLFRLLFPLLLLMRPCRSSPPAAGGRLFWAPAPVPKVVPVPGWRRDRDRPKAVAEDDEDMLGCGVQGQGRKAAVSSSRTVINFILGPCSWLCLAIGGHVAHRVWCLA